MKNKVVKIIISLALLLTLCILASCSADTLSSENKDKDETKDEISYNSAGQIDKSPLVPSVEDKRVQPDLSKVSPKSASKSVADTSSEEKLIEALESFANPNGNKYDAMAVLGDFSYSEKGDALLERFERAGKSWHEQIVSKVGEKCIVDISLKSKGDISTTADNFAQWQSIYGGIGQDYTNVKCIIKSNYSTSSVEYSIDIVKIDGKWHLASRDVLEKLQDIITVELFR